MKVQGNIPKEWAAVYRRGHSSVRFEFESLGVHGYIRDSGLVNVYGRDAQVIRGVVAWINQDPDAKIEEGTIFKGLVIEVRHDSMMVQIGLFRLAGWLHNTRLKTNHKCGGLVWVKVIEFKRGLLFLEEVEQVD